MKAAGVIQSSEIHERAGKLAAALKDRVDRRSFTDAYATYRDLADDTGTSEEWCYNALKASLFSVVFPSKFMDVRAEDDLVFVPVNFGHERI
jgi:hypothetical protein